MTSFLAEKNKKLIIILAVLPGAAHAYLGNIKKTLVLFVIDAGIIVGLLFSKSYIMKVVVVNIYLFTPIPAAMETYQQAKKKKSRINTDSRWYVIILLLTTGFNALPLLWASKEFSHASKIIWSILVPLLAIAFFYVLIAYWQELDIFLKEVLT